MSTEGIKNIIEACIFASDEEITGKEIKDLLDTFRISVSLKEIEASIEDLNSEYEKNSSAFEIIKLAGGYIFATRKKFSHFLGKLSAETQKKKLSQSAIETLAIIAYKQPITRSEIEFVRGVNVDYIVNSLLERDLITIKGRADGPGRPILYGTTSSFLKVLGLNAIEDLPKLKEINEILKNEKIEGISEADIDLFNSMSTQAQAEVAAGTTNEQLEFKENVEEAPEDKELDNSGEEALDDLALEEIPEVMDLKEDNFLNPEEEKEENNEEKDDGEDDDDEDDEDDDENDEDDDDDKSNKTEEEMR